MNEFNDANAYAIEGAINLLEITMRNATITQTVMLDGRDVSKNHIGIALCYRERGSDVRFDLAGLLGYKEARLYSTVSKAQKALADLLHEHSYLQKLNPDQVILRKKEIEESLQITQNILDRTK